MTKNIFTVRFKTVYLPEGSSVLPGHLYELVNCNQLELTYGLKKMSVSITPFSEELDVEGSSFVYISKDVAENLFLYPSQTYQLLLGDELKIGSTIGLLLGNCPKDYTPEYIEEHYSDRRVIQSFLKMNVVAFSLEWINLKEMHVRGLVYKVSTNSWVFEHVPVPIHIYGRHLHQKGFHTFLKNFELKNGILFNSIRSDKWLVHKQLALLQETNIHLATTEKLTFEAQLLN